MPRPSAPSLRPLVPALLGCLAVVGAFTWSGSIAAPASEALRLIVGLLAVLLPAAVYVRRLRAQARRQAAERDEARRLALRLEEARLRLQSLRGLLAMCSWCKSIRDGSGEWLALESYLELHLETALTHGVCPECLRVEYPDLFQAQGGAGDGGA